jgi:hypothetical protein
MSKNEMKPEAKTVREMVLSLPPEVRARFIRRLASLSPELAEFQAWYRKWIPPKN